MANLKKLQESIRTVHLLDVTAFFNLFADLLPEGVEIDEYFEQINNSDISFGANTDTLMGFHEAFTFLFDACPASYQETLRKRFVEIDTMLDEVYDMETEFFISIGS